MGRWGETGVPLENHLTHPQAELGLSQMWPVQGSNLHQTQRWDDRMIKSAEIQRPYPLGHRGRLLSFLALQPGLCQTLSETPKTGFLVWRLKWKATNNMIYYIWKCADHLQTKKDADQHIKSVKKVCSAVHYRNEKMLCEGQCCSKCKFLLFPVVHVLYNVWKYVWLSLTSQINVFFHVT